MPSKKQKTPLIPGKYYHIYNRGNNKEQLFFSDQDYSFFIKKYQQFTAPHIRTYAFCLLPNHFHFLVYLEERDELPVKFYSNQFRKLFITYTARINTLQKRTGGLFTKSFQRIEVKDVFYLRNLIVYIHRNPTNHGIALDFQKYRYSSYSAIIHDDSYLCSKEEIMDWFGGEEGFLKNHMVDAGDMPIFDVHYLEEDRVPVEEIESLDAPLKIY